MMYRFLLPAAAILASASAAAEDAGRVRQSATPAPPRPEPPPPSLTAGAGSAPTVAVPGASFAVQRIVVVGNHILTAAETEAAVARFQGRVLDQDGLAELAAALREEYRVRGYFLTEVYIPPQAVVAGELTVLVSEGYLAEDGLDIDNRTRAPTGLLHDVLATAAKPGAVFRRDRIERALLLLEDMPGVTAEHEIAPGESVGEGRLRTLARDSGLIHGEVDADNFGSYPTGTWRLGAAVDVEGLAGRGDRLRLRGVVASESLVQGELDASFLATASGTRLGAGIVYIDFAQKRELSVLDAEGRSLEATARASHPIERSLERTQRLILRGSWLDLRDEQAGQESVVRTIPSATLEWSGDWTIQAGITTWAIGVTAGSVDLSGAYADQDAIGAQTAGGFARCDAIASHRQRLGGEWSGTLELQGQLASGNLDSSQQFAIGGPFSMAGYPVAEIVADRGIRSDLSIARRFATPPWQGDLSLSLGYQVAWAQLHADPWDGWDAYSRDDNTVVVQSAYLAAEQTWPAGVLLRGQLGWRWEDNPVSDPETGLDTDFSDDRLRAWVQAVYYF
jgi:hemolysin activation/secretion protein